MMIFQNATLIDGTGAQPMEAMDVIIEGSAIQEVGRRLPVKEGDQVYDLTGKTLIPGLSDAHTHFGGSDRFDRPLPPVAGRHDTSDYEEARNQALKWGVTTMRSCGDVMPDIIRYRDDVDAGLISSPRIIACGRLYQAPEGHPYATVFFHDKTIASSVAFFIDESSDIDSEVKKMVDAGADFIKAFASDDNTMVKPTATVPCLKENQLKSIADAAHKYGKKLSVHVDDCVDMERALNAGADIIEHVFSSGTPVQNRILTSQLLDKILARNVWIVPTLVRTKVYASEEILEEAFSAVSKLRAAGVRMGVGCDSGCPKIPFGESVHTELELLCKAGMSPLEALTASTGNNAKLFERDGEFGTVRKGEAADFLVLNSDPLQDIRNTRDIFMVIRNGAIKG